MNAKDPRQDAWQSLIGPLPRTNGAMKAQAATSTPRVFRFFDPDDAAAATNLAREFDAIAGEHPTTADLQNVMARFHKAASTNEPLAKAALTRFVTQRPGTSLLPIPTLRQKLGAIRKQDPKRFDAALQTAQALVVGPEDALNYYRHDLDLSDHHKHWHDLYQFSGPKSPDLQGRLFLWMHQQMLARYDAERLAAGLPAVQPLLTWDSPAAATIFDDTALPTDALAPWIPVESPGYLPFDHGGQSARTLDPGDTSKTIAGLQLVAQKISSGSYASYNDLGRDLEASVTLPTTMGAGPHNMGHMAFGTLSNGGSDVMVSPEVAMTTPIFYQWHRTIDDYGFQWQEKQGSDPWSYRRPSVTMRRSLDGSTTSTLSPDLIVTPRALIPGIGSGFDLDGWGVQTFGGANFDKAADPRLNVSVLQTQMLADQLMSESRLSIKDHWVYFLRLRSVATTSAQVTVRIWLCPVQWVSNRRAWFEMDKFTTTVPASSAAVVARPGWHSTVIRQKTVGEPMTLASEDDDRTADSSDEQSWCDCGLPYRLLLPHGTGAGMSFRFMVLLTDAAEDGLAPDPSEPDGCGSVSFCGKNDLSWPDKKEIGFPFHRPFPTVAQGVDPIAAFFATRPEAVWRDILIQNIDSAGN